jgi:VWFA-related protein
MTRGPLSGAAVLLLAATAATQQQPVFHTTADAVAVDVAVMRGRTPVLGLAAKDFQVLDNGVAQQIEAISMGAVPIDVTLVLDLAGSTASVWSEFRADVERMRAMLKPVDRLRLIGIGFGPRELAPMRPATEPLPANAIVGGGTGTSLHDAIFHALARPSEPERRHLVVAFTDGFDTWSILDGSRLPALAERADAVLHAVVTASPPASVPDGINRSSSTITGGVVTDVTLSSGQMNARARAWTASQNALFSAVARTGGALHHVSDRVAAFERVLAEFRSSYVLHYIPRGVTRPGWHEIKVTVPRQGGLDIRSRRGYDVAKDVPVPSVLTPCTSTYPDVGYVEARGVMATKAELPQGTLDLLILTIVAAEPRHGYAIAQRLRQMSKDVIQVRQGSLYPALHRLEQRGLLAPEWRDSETGREAKYYGILRAAAAETAS